MLEPLREIRQLTLDLRARMATPPAPPAPLLKDFSERFINEYARANRQKERGVGSKESHLRVHLIPRLGERPLDSISEPDIQKLKADLVKRKPKTVNNILSTLSKLLKVAVKWRVIKELPVTIEPLHSAVPAMTFYDFTDYYRLCDFASEIDPRVHVLVLLGGDAGLRMGEIIAIEWPDIDWENHQLWVKRAQTQGIVSLPKGGKPRYVPMTDQLEAALRVLLASRRSEREKRVLLRDNGHRLSEQTARTWMTWAQRAARMSGTGLGGLHKLRHTFCSHLAMKGAPMLAIKELAGHTDLRTTQRYMHLAPNEARNAIALLNVRNPNGKQ